LRRLLAKYQWCLADGDRVAGMKRYRLPDRHSIHPGSIGTAPIKDLPLAAVPTDVTVVP
jgi:hypothetical protein